MKEKFKKLLSVVSAMAVTIVALPITKLLVISETETTEVMNELTNFRIGIYA